MAASELRAIFEPASVVLVGASDKPSSVGFTVLRNLTSAEYEGELFLVNPGHTEILGQRSYASVAELPCAPDLAVIVTPAQAVPDVIDDCGRRGTRGAVVISADVGFGEVLDYLVTDRKTDSIMLYVEGVKDARRFMSALRAAARVKPVIVMKTGRHAEGSRAALSHTGSLVGADDVFDAALRRAGVLRVLEFADFFSAATILDAGVRSRGNRLCIVTNGGGPAVLAADHCAERDVSLAELSPATMRTLDQTLPGAWSKGNPVDVLGDAPPERYEAAVGAGLSVEVTAIVWP